VADWNWQGYENRTLNVVVYSSCDEVELFLNGKSLGKKKTDRDAKYLASYEVPYAAGELKAVGYTKNKKVQESFLKTAGSPTDLVLTAEKTMLHANNQDLTYINVEVKDDKGITNPKTELPVQFSVEGAGTIAGVGNANPASVESCHSNTRKTWKGKCLLIVKAGKERGDIKITATAGNIKTKELVIKVD